MPALDSDIILSLTSAAQQDIGSGYERDSFQLMKKVKKKKVGILNIVLVSVGAAMIAGRACFLTTRVGRPGSMRREVAGAVAAADQVVLKMRGSFALIWRQ